MRYARHTPLCFIPLYRLNPENEGSPFSHHGTGILVLYKDRPLLMTAAHVVNDAPAGLGVYLITDHKIHPLPNQFQKTFIPDGSTIPSKDIFDFAVIVLSPELAAGITFEAIGFFVLHELPSGALASGVELMFAGYPEITSEGKNCAYHTSGGAQIILRPQCLHSPLLPPTQYPDTVFNPEVCLVATFMNPNTRKEGEGAAAPFLPGGMSGGPIFAVQHNFVQLVGVSTNWRQEGGYLIGTRLSAVAETIEKAMP